MIGWEGRRGGLKQRVLDPEGKSACPVRVLVPDSVRLPGEGGI